MQEVHADKVLMLAIGNNDYISYNKLFDRYYGRLCQYVYSLLMDRNDAEDVVQELFLNLWKIGYTKKELNKIVRQEVISYYFVLILIPLVYIVFISGRFIYYGDMSFQFAFIYVLSYVIPIIISGFITYVQYIDAVVKPIKGGK